MKARRSLLVLAFALVTLTLVLTLPGRLPLRLAPARQLSLATSSLPSRSPVTAPRSVVIQKGERALGLYLDGRLRSAYPIALGRDPEGRKTREGDGRTPEGLYFICNRNPHSQFHLFLGISYPNTQDAEAAQRIGLITQAQYRAIAQASSAHRQPPWDTPLGGEIGIHGGGTAADWTLGCIALENAAIEELWRVLRVGDPVLIQP
jgi:murein L,D-transpeptidase YafK